MQSRIHMGPPFNRGGALKTVIQFWVPTLILLQWHIDFTAKDITVQAHAFTKSAREAIEGAGGKCEILKPSTGAVVEA